MRVPNLGSQKTVVEKLDTYYRRPLRSLSCHKNFIFVFLSNEETLFWLNRPYHIILHPVLIFFAPIT